MGFDLDSNAGVDNKNLGSEKWERAPNEKVGGLIWVLWRCSNHCKKNIIFIYVNDVSITSRPTYTCH
jgi:hypothetical protein